MSHSLVPEPAQNAWNEQLPLYEKITADGMRVYAETLPDFEKAFEPTDRVVRCIDEGCAGGVHAAGSLILVPLDEARSYCEKAEVTALTSHAGCGAAKLHYMREHGSDLPDTATVDAHADSQVRMLADKLGVEYAGQISADQMCRPSQCHVARAAYYVGTEDFNPRAVPGLPPGFVINRRYLSKESALAEVEIAISIGMDKASGFGELISSEHPFYIIPVGDPDDEEFDLSALTFELLDVSARPGGVVTVDGFSAPLEEF